MLVATLYALCCTSVAHAAEADTRRVFVLNSFNRGYSWTDNMLRGIDDAFGAPGVKVETYVTFMDLKRVPNTPEYAAQLKGLIREGYKGITFDAVLACDNDALAFLRKNRDELFPSVPVVFSSINDFDPGMLDGRKDITGTSENTPYAETIRCAIKLMPETRTIVVVVDNTTTGKAHRSAVEKIQHEFAGTAFTYISLADMTLNELAAKLSRLDKDSIVLLLQHFVDQTGTAYTVQQSTPLLAANAAVPAFVVTDIRVGLGALGGVVVSGYHHGEAAARMVMKILTGTDVATIPVLLDSPNKYMFDYKVMQRFKIQERNLPQGSIVLNRPVSLLEVYKLQLSAVLIAFVVMSVTLVYLLIQIRRRERAEAVLREQERQLTELMRNLPGMVYRSSHERNGTMVFVSEGCLALTGYRPEDLLGNRKLSFNDLVLPEYREVLWQKWQAVLARHSYFQEEYPIRTANGEIRWVWERGRGVFDSDNKLLFLEGYVEDITGRKQAVEREKELLGKLERAARMESLGVLAGGVAHDLNNILGPIAVLPDMVAEYLAKVGEEHDPEYEDTLEALRTIMVSARRAAGVVSDLVVMGRRGQFRKEPVDVNKVVEQLMDSKQIRTIQAAHAAVKLTKRLAASPPRCLGSASRLERVLTNLVGNAFEAFDGNGDVVVSTSRQTLVEPFNGYEVVPAGDYVMIEVSDTGSGIDSKTLPRIFEPFFSTKAPGERSGSGLGLSVVHGLVKDHSGFLDVKSTPGKGASFIIYLPVEEIVDVPAEMPNAAMPRGCERVLVIDDEPGQQFLAKHQLSRLGYDVKVVSSGAEAVALFKTARDAGRPAPFDLVMVDMIMRGMDGLATCRKILEMAPDQKLIISSGHAPHGYEEQVKSMGADWLHKPYTAGDLANAVRSRLSR